MIGFDYDGVLTEPGWYEQMRARVDEGLNVAVLTSNMDPDWVALQVRRKGFKVPPVVWSGTLYRHVPGIVAVVRFKRSDLEGKAIWIRDHGGGTLIDDDPKFGEPCALHGVRWVPVRGKQSTKRRSVRA